MYYWHDVSVMCTHLICVMYKYLCVYNKYYVYTTL